MAWAPPMRYTSSTPAMAAAASVASGGMPVGAVGRDGQDDLGHARHPGRDAPS